MDLTCYNTVYTFPKTCKKSKQAFTKTTDFPKGEKMGKKQHLNKLSCSGQLTQWTKRDYSCIIILPDIGWNLRVK